MHPDIIDAEYLRHVWRPDSVHTAAQRDWDGIRLWAQEYATQAEEGPRGLEAVPVNGAEEVLYSGGHNHCAPVGRAASRIST
jgi:hypothetical protein